MATKKTKKVVSKQANLPGYPARPKHKKAMASKMDVPASLQRMKQI